MALECSQNCTQKEKARVRPDFSAYENPNQNYITTRLVGFLQ